MTQYFRILMLFY